MLGGMDEADRRQRAEARRSRASLRRTRLKPREDDLSPIRGVEAISLVHRLTLESWALAGLDVPTYTRDQLPVRFVPR